MGSIYFALASVASIGSVILFVVLPVMAEITSVLAAL